MVSTTQGQGAPPKAELVNTRCSEPQASPGTQGPGPQLDSGEGEGQPGGGYS